MIVLLIVLPFVNGFLNAIRVRLSKDPEVCPVKLGRFTILIGLSWFLYFIFLLNFIVNLNK